MVSFLKYNPDSPLQIPAFLDRREFIDIVTVDGEQPNRYVVYCPEDAEIYDPHVRRVWAPMRAIGEIKKHESSPAAMLYCANKTWPVQVVSKGKNPRNLFLHESWDEFLKFHDFDDYPVERTFSGQDVSYVVVKNDAARNEIVQAAMAGGVPLNTRPELMEQNGVKRPKTGSITAAAWASFDHMLANSTDFKLVFEKLKEGGMNPSTIRTQYAHWRKFNNVSK